MFTGIIQALGTVESVQEREGDARLCVALGDLSGKGFAAGESIAVNGVCLTAVEPADTHLVADVSRETLQLTTLGRLQEGDKVNLEPALAAGQRLGGHLVSGHVDGVGKLVEKRRDARSWRLFFEAPAELARYIAKKGSICIDGISLTVNGVDGARFDVNIVPHTLHATNLQHLDVGAEVNLEVDVVARYLERLLASDKPQVQESQGVTMALLRERGFIDDNKS